MATLTVEAKDLKEGDRIGITAVRTVTEVHTESGRTTVFTKGSQFAARPTDLYVVNRVTDDENRTWFEGAVKNMTSTALMTALNLTDVTSYRFPIMAAELRSRS